MDEENSLEEVSVDNAEGEGLRIANDVIAAIANKAASEVSGVFSMSGGISDVFGKKMSKGIKVDAGEKSTKIDVNIIVEYGVRIPDIAYEIQNRVKKAVESMTGLDVLEVNVHVQGVNLPEDNISTEV
ncbi:MAG: Asp23/Gls24 family envelope stress response protein [Clostridia bacterium]|nr:Asp23/Gls24 family envelope stress response protein [Clostridia bacterium]